MKKNTIKVILSIVVVLGLVLGIWFAVGRPPAEQQVEEQPKAGEPAPEKNIVFWHHESPEHRVAAFQKLIDLFTKEHPNVTMKQEIVSWGETWIKTIAAIEAGNPPDFQFGIPDLVMTKYRADAIMPVTDLVKEIDGRYDYFEIAKNMFYHEGEFWGVPIMTMVCGFAYRPSLLEKYLGTTDPPETWDEMLEYARKINEAGGGQVFGIGLAGGRNLFSCQQAYMFLSSAGGRFFDEKGNVIFNSPETIRFLEAYKELFEYSPPGTEAWMWGEMEMNLAAGVFAMAPYFPAIQLRMHDLDSDDLGFTHMPLVAPGAPRGGLQYPNNISIFRKADERGNTDTVKDFVRFIMQPDINVNLTAGMEPGAFLPVTRAAAEADVYWNNEVINRFLDVNKTAIELLEHSTLFGFEHGRWVNLGTGDITGANVLSATLQMVLTNQMTPEEAAAWGASEMEKMSIPITE